MGLVFNQSEVRPKSLTDLHGAPTSWGDGPHRGHWPLCGLSKTKKNLIPATEVGLLPDSGFWHGAMILKG